MEFWPMQFLKVISLISTTSIVSLLQWRMIWPEKKLVPVLSERNFFSSSGRPPSNPQCGTYSPAWRGWDSSIALHMALLPRTVFIFVIPHCFLLNCSISFKWLKDQTAQISPDKIRFLTNSFLRHTKHDNSSLATQLVMHRRFFVIADSDPEVRFFLYTRKYTKITRD